MSHYILAIDQGTTSTRALLVDQQANIFAVSQKSFEQFFPKNGWVEHDPEEIWASTLSVIRSTIKQAGGVKAINTIGITNQRETTIVWDKHTGKAVYPAIVWQDRRTAKFCQQWREAGHETLITEKTGLLLDPYFSASKLRWILNEVPGAREKAQAGELLFGTIDSFLIWRLSKGASHVTDATNASRTQLFNIHTQAWDDGLLALFDIPKAMLPEVKDNVDDFGKMDAEFFGQAVPITGVAGDQQAAAFGQACFKPGMIKSTYGTGCFALVNTGDQPLSSSNRLLTTVLSRVNGQVQYALEGSIFVAGAAVKWLHEKLGVIDTPAETEQLAASLTSNEGVYMVPAFTGLGAPHWQPDVRASLLGMTRDTPRAAIARAALEAVCYQTMDLFAAMKRDGVSNLTQLRVDGGMSANAWFLQYLSDVLALEVSKPRHTEITALGAAFMAGLKTGFFESMSTIEQLWQADQNFLPSSDLSLVEQSYARWQKAVEATLSFA